MRILVIAPSWIGDAVLAQPLFKRLHSKFPNLVLDVLAPSWVQPVFKFMKEVNSTHITPYDHGELKLMAQLKLAKDLSQNNYDQAIVLPNSFKSALIPFFARIPTRVGFLGEMRYGLLNKIHRLDKKELPLMAERFAQLAEEPGVKRVGVLPSPQLSVDKSAQQIALNQLGLTMKLPVAIFCPGAEYGPAKRWPASYFAELAAKLKQQGHQIWLLGSANDRSIGDEIEKQNTDACVNLCGKTDLQQAIALISLATVVVSNDSGLMHIAAALNRPLIALFGSSSPRFTPPLSAQARVLTLNLECSPCFARTCPLGHFKCMNDLTPQQVLKEVHSISPTTRDLN